MLQSLFVAVNAVIPFLIYMVFGFCAHAAGVVSKEFLDELNRVIFKLMFPFVTFYNIYSADISDLPGRTLIIFSIASLLILQAVLLVVVPLIVKENSRRGVIIQAIFRSNFVLFALPLVLSVYGDTAGSTAAVIVTIVVTIYNITSVIILELFHSKELSETADGQGAGRKGRTRELALSIAKNVVKNPLLQGACVGIVFLLAGITLPSAIDSVVETFSDLATPLALFILGGTLNFGSLKKNLRYLLPGLFVKLIAVPAVMMSIAYALGLRSLELFLVLAMYGTPIAVASYPMAQNMGGDGELAGHFVMLSTVLSVLTLFLWIFVLDAAALL